MKPHIFIIIPPHFNRMYLEALCIFQPCVSALHSHIDFPPEAKLFWHSILQPWTTLKECESLFCSMLFLYLKKKKKLDSVMWSEMLIVKGKAGKHLQQTWQAYTFKWHRIQSWEEEAPLKTWITDSARGKNSCLSLFLSMSCYRVFYSLINMLLMELSRGYYCTGSYCELK